MGPPELPARIEEKIASIRGGHRHVESGVSLYWNWWPRVGFLWSIVWELLPLWHPPNASLHSAKRPPLWWTQVHDGRFKTCHGHKLRWWKPGELGGFPESLCRFLSSLRASCCHGCCHGFQSSGTLNRSKQCKHMTQSWGLFVADFNGFIVSHLRGLLPGWRVPEGQRHWRKLGHSNVNRHHCCHWVWAAEIRLKWVISIGFGWAECPATTSMHGISNGFLHYRL